MSSVTTVWENLFLWIVERGVRLTGRLFYLVMRGSGAAEDDARQRADDYEKWALIGVSIGVGVGSGLYSAAWIDTEVNPRAWEKNPELVTRLTGVRAPHPAPARPTLTPVLFGKGSAQVH